MFQSVGKSRPAKNRVGAFLLSLTLNGGLIGLALLLAAPAATPEVIAETTLGRPYELVAPASAPPGGSPAPRKAAKRTPTPAPVMVPVEPSPATPAVEPAPSDSDGPADADDGPGGKGPGGEGPPGSPPGGGGGLGDGSGGGMRTVHWSEVAVRTRAQVRPEDYPRAALDMGLPDTRCVVRIEIDTRGVPTAVVPKICPEVFRASAEDIGLRYRFYPLLGEDRRPIPAAFDLTLNFRKP